MEILAATRIRRMEILMGTIQTTQEFPLKLDFDLPDFVRINWASAKSQSDWEGRIAEINREWARLERRLIPSIVSLDTFELRNLARTKEVFRVLDVVPKGDSYSTASREFKGGDPSFRVLLGSHLPLDNDVAIGRLLGYPDCCVHKFTTLWPRVKDFTWHLTIGSESVKDVEGDLLCNVLLRWIGVRAVRHLPCSFNCQASAELARIHLADLPPQVAENIRQILSWDMHWSSYHGIVEVITPHFKLIANGDAWAEKLELHYESAKVFWNGFNTEAAQDEGHARIVKAFERYFVVENRITKISTVTDLGCGNGLLLKKLLYATSIGLSIGVDCTFYEPFHADQFVKCALKNYPMAGSGVALIAQQRLMEDMLRPSYPYLVVYNYDKLEPMELGDHYEQVALYLDLGVQIFRRKNG